MERMALFSMKRTRSTRFPRITARETVVLPMSMASNIILRKKLGPMEFVMTFLYTLPRRGCQTKRKGQPLAGLSLRHGVKLSLTGLQFNNILGLLTLGAFCALKLDLLAFFQGFVPVPLNQI